MAIKREELKELLGEEVKSAEITSLLNFFNDRLKTELKAFDGFISPDKHKEAIDELKNAPAPKAELPTEDIAELARLRKFETDIIAEKTTASKITAIKKGLETLKAHPDAIDLLSLKFDLNSIELDSKGEIKGFNDLAKPIQEAHSKFFGVDQIVGVPPGKAPAQFPSGKPEPKTFSEALLQKQNK